MEVVVFMVALSIKLAEVVTLGFVVTVLTANVIGSGCLSSGWARTRLNLMVVA